MLWGQVYGNLRRGEIPLPCARINAMDWQIFAAIKILQQDGISLPYVRTNVAMSV